MELKEFNLRFLAELTRFNPKLRHLSTGSQQHPLFVKVLLYYVRTDIRDIGLEATMKSWRHFVGVEDNPAALIQAKKYNDNPDSTMGIQINIFPGKSDKGRQLRLDRLCKLTPDAPEQQMTVIEDSDGW